MVKEYIKIAITGASGTSSKNQVFFDVPYSGSTKTITISSSMDDLPSSSFFMKL